MHHRLGTTSAYQYVRRGNLWTLCEPATSPEFHQLADLFGDGGGCVSSRQGDALYLGDRLPGVAMLPILPRHAASQRRQLRDRKLISSRVNRRLSSGGQLALCRRAAGSALPTCVAQTVLAAAIGGLSTSGPALRAVGRRRLVEEPRPVRAVTPAAAAGRRSCVPPV